MERRIIITFVALIFSNLVVSANPFADTTKTKHFGDWEIAFTPRFTLRQDFSTSPKDSIQYFDFNGIFRLQVGKKLNTYTFVHTFFDYFVRRTDNELLGKSFDGLGFGIQLEQKMHSELVCSRKFRVYGKYYVWRCFPSLLVTAGVSNVQSGVKSRSLGVGKELNLYAAIGTGLSVFINQYFSVQFVYQLEYYPSIKSYPFRSLPMQTKFIYKI